MQHSDFRIGDVFHTLAADGPRKWQVTDVGTRTVVALRVGSAEITSVATKTPLPPGVGQRHFRTEDLVETRRVLSEEELRAEGWFSGPPYMLAETVFDEYDLEGCARTPEEL